MGTVHAGTIYGTKLKIGGGTNEDIYFEDSGIRLYDAGSNQLRFYKSGLAPLSLYFSNGVRLYTSGSFVSLHAGSYIFAAKSTGTFKLPSLASAPAGATGDLAFDDGDKQLKLHTQGAWRHFYTYAGW